jgi:hypothetical protein
MDLSITTKFTVATEQSIKALLFLTHTIIREKLTALVPEQKIEHYILKHFGEQTLINEVNSMNNQWLIVYADDKPVGYARITSKGEKPAALTQKRTISIADFGILREYTDAAVKQSLFNKCWQVCKYYEATWIKEYSRNPLIALFELEGFTRLEETAEWNTLPLHSVSLLKLPL